MSSSIKKGAIISYIAIFLNIAISFLYTPWMIRKIGVSDYGLYSLVLSFISYFILDFGLNQAIQRFIAKYRAENNEDKVAKMVGITTRVYLIIDMAIFTVLTVMYFFLEGIFTGLTPDELERLKGLYIIAAIFSVLSFMFKPMAGAMMAYEFFVEEKTLEMVNRVGAVVLVCIALALGADVYSLVFINGAVSLLTSICTFYIFKRKSNLDIQWSYFDKRELNNIFSFSMWTFGSGLAQRLRFSLIPSILGVLSNSTEIAIFSLGVSLEGMVFTLSSGLNGLFLPRISRMSQAQSRSEILQLMVRIGRLQLYLIGLIFSGFLIFGPAFLKLWVGDEFSKAYLVLIFLIVSNIVSLTQSIANDLVYVENEVKNTAIRIFVTSLLGFAIACVLAPRYGAIGCSIGTCIGLCIYQVWINVFYQNKLGIDIGKFFTQCHMKILPLLVLLTIVSFYILAFFTLDSWLKLLVAASVYVVIFLIVSYLFLFNKDEKQLFIINTKQ